MSGHHKWSEIKRKFKSKRREHQIPLGTKVAFEGDSTVYETADYQTVLECDNPCGLTADPTHECWEEPCVCVRETITHFRPLSQLKTIFGEDSMGRDPTPEEKSPGV